MTAPELSPSGGRQWTLTHNERPMTANKYRTLHFHTRTAYDTQVRQAFGWLARQQRIPPLKAVIVTAVPVVRKGTTLPDTAACTATVKAGIDGLVDARVIPNDTPEFVHAVTFVAPTHGPADSLILLVEEAL